MTGEPTLLFCAGATKAATSWLYSYLFGHPDCSLRRVKELHYFFVKERDAKWYIDDTTRKIERLKRDLEDAPLERVADLADELRDLKEIRRLMRHPDDAKYIAFLTEGRGNRKVVADVTPAYALLPVEQLSLMARLLPDVRFLYILRDPVARLWSHVRMIASRRDPAGKVERQRAERILAKVMEGREPAIAERSDYRGDLERLRHVVEPDRLMVVFYEEFLTPEGIGSLCSFLGIRNVPPDLDRRVYEGKPLTMAPELMRTARDWLRPQYDYIEKTMGRLPDAWHAALSEV